ncbi:hypothetical protein Cni_G28054 [Canna indica]|uniref:Uncharacterized protein n=1 Tax=Canna indica TaxID=4628 RepID=A0AAQ3L6T8_9LILI|nr:hypothetical protein Cni_G28054 [Canna indica]
MEALPLLVLATATMRLLVSPAAASALPGCRSSCGRVDIPYPFGIGSNCSKAVIFEIDCSRDDNGVEKPFQGDVEVLNISLLHGQLRFLNHISSQCYNASNKSIIPDDWSLDLPTGYRFSDTHNKFTVIGCQTLAYIGDNDSNVSTYETGCVSVCRSEQSMRNGSCVGIGCCETSIPKGLEHYEVWFDADFNTSGIYSFSHCSYAVLMEAASFRFQTSYVTTDDFVSKNGGAPVVVDWVVGGETCEEAKRNESEYACKSENSECLDSINGPGYLCNCSRGYRGNPYLLDGCQDIDECAEKEQYPCTGVCRNLAGGYRCLCPPGTGGNPVNGTCYPDQKLPMAVKLAIGICSSIAFLLFCIMCIYMIYQRKQLRKMKERHFKEHGGWQLLEEINGKQGIIFKIFTIKEIEKATHNFDKNRVLGRGGHGTVYKGILQDNHVVAIKKSKFIDESQKNEYGKELLILSQINHKNIVKLLGCCLEVDVPILVYEFVSNGTLFHLIHEKRSISSFSLGARLKIAYDSADALAYLHSTASPPIIHGDVKSSNILLDENYVAKVSDFGASKLVPKDKDQLATLVQGTCGYLDPEYLQTCKLTEKSDVYSFGVVFLELLTGKKAVYFEESEEERSLALTFMLAMKENRLSEILDSQVRDEEEDIEYIRQICELAKRCLNVSGEGRPTMKEVAEELDKLRKLKQHSWVQRNVEEIETEFGEASNGQGVDTTIDYTSEKISALNIECR